MVVIYYIFWSKQTTKWEKASNNKVNEKFSKFKTKNELM